MSDFEQRFRGIAQLYGADGLAWLRRSRVCVVGLGGVGSWTVEALARSGIGALTLVDLDEVCVSNVNRQLHALDGAVGRAKAGVLAGRVRAINPECDVQPVVEFFTEANAGKILAERFDFIVDAIDSLANKCRLIAAARERGLPIVTTGGAGGRRDPTAIRVADLAFTGHDRLLQKVRRQLRRDHGFPGDDTPFGVDCVFSPEPVVFARRDGTVCAEKPDETGAGDLKLNCDFGLGSATFVTGAFGFVAAGVVVKKLAAAQ